MATWPSTLPTFVQQDGYDESPPNLTISSQPELGPPKLRRRCSAGMRKISAVILCTLAQVETLDTFYTSTLLGGSATFIWVHPRTQAPCTMVLLSPPAYAPVGIQYTARLELGILP